MRRVRACGVMEVQVAYDGTWRDADPAEVKRRLDAGDPYTIRFKVPKGKVVTIHVSDVLALPCTAVILKWR